MTARARRLVAPAATGLALAATVLALHVRDPQVRGSWGICPSAALGFACPACGTLRAVHHLSNGDVAAAASSNLLLVLAAPVLVAVLIVWTWSRWRDRPVSWRPQRRGPAALVAVVVVVVFTALRNLPLGAWLAP